MLSTSTGSFVICTASPPSSAIFHTCDEPLRVERKTRDLPSLVQRAPLSFASCAVTWRDAEPSTALIQMSVLPLFASTSVTRTV